MAASQLHVTDQTPMGANLVAGGATFRAWAPNARGVYVVLNDPGAAAPSRWSKNPDDLLVKDANGYWSGFLPGVKEGEEYRFYVVGDGGEGFKRDPYARELVFDGYPECNCVVRDPEAYRWHDRSFIPPRFDELIVYQFHIGVFYAKDETGKDIRPHRVNKVLDAIDRIEYFADLGVNAIMPLPFQEYQGENSLGYNGTDLFSPEMDYSVRPGELPRYLARVNALLAKKGEPAMTLEEFSGQVHQFKTFIDLCHLYGIAVLADVVYNHAGRPFDEQCLYFFDRQRAGDNDRSLYFLRDEHAGGQVFAFWKQEVRQFLIDNGKSLYREYHVDGLRCDQVTVIDEHGGWGFAQDLTGTLRATRGSAIQIAEYWGTERWKGVAVPPFGMGFDAGYSDVLRQNVRRTITETTHGKGAPVNMDRLRDALYMTYKDPGRWTVFQCIENHDLLDVRHGDRQPRIPALADPTNARSWFARSRSKVATGLLLTAPGIPMIFMGQEFLEDKFWSDYPKQPELLIWWEGLEGADKHMADQHRFTRDLMWLRRNQPALRGDGINVFHVHNDNRVMAFHRWVSDGGPGHDVVVVVSLNENTFGNRTYRIGFPSAGHWEEVFNSDIYDDYFNPNAQGNYGGVTAGGPPWDSLPFSGEITIPANSLLVFAHS